MIPNILSADTERERRELPDDLSEDFEWVPHDDCPICGETAFRRLADVRSALEYRRCAECSHTQAIPEDEYVFVGQDDHRENTNHNPYWNRNWWVYALLVLLVLVAILLL